MQAIARVNRIFKVKEAGLIVDYIGLATELEKALAEYTKSDRDLIAIPQEIAVERMKAHFEVVKDMFHGYDYHQFFTAPTQQRMGIMMDAMEHILAQEKCKDRYLKETSNLLYSFAVAMPADEAVKIRDDVGFFQAVKAAIVKNTDTKTVQAQNMDTAIKQILSEAIVSDRVIDVFAAAGLKKPNIELLSDEFLENVRELPQKNLAFETLKKLLNDQIKFRQKKPDSSPQLRRPT
jgi:type I restriction enzyme R subunit